MVHGGVVVARRETHGGPVDWLCTSVTCTSVCLGDGQCLGEGQQKNNNHLYTQVITYPDPGVYINNKYKKNRLILRFELGT